MLRITFRLYRRADAVGKITPVYTGKRIVKHDQIPCFRFSGNFHQVPCDFKARGLRNIRLLNFMSQHSLCVPAVHPVPIDAFVDRAAQDVDVLRREACVIQAGDETVQMVAIAYIADVVV